LLALVCLGLGSGLLVFELGRPWQFWRVFSRQRAVLTFGAWMVGLLVLVDALYFSCGLAWFPWAGSEALRAVVAILALALGFGVLLYTGIELASMKARVFWNTPALPIVFALGGLLCGCAADYLLVLVSGNPGFVAAVLPPGMLSAGALSAGALPPGALPQLGAAQLAAQLVALPILLVGIAIFGFLTLMALMLYLLLMLTSAGPEARVVAQRWLKGRYALAFWLGLVVLGLAVPLLLAGFALAAVDGPGLELVMLTDGFGLVMSADGLAVDVDSVALAAGGVAALCAICGGVFLRFLVVYSDDRRSLAGEMDYWAHLPQGDEPFLKCNWG
jgi:formate-dependent nitrite reductase membrane component NrfD